MSDKTLKKVRINGKTYYLKYVKPFWLSKKRWEAFSQELPFTYDAFQVAVSDTYNGLISKLRRIK